MVERKRVRSRLARLRLAGPGLKNFWPIQMKPSHYFLGLNLLCAAALAAAWLTAASAPSTGPNPLRDQALVLVARRDVPADAILDGPEDFFDPVWLDASDVPPNCAFAIVNRQRRGQREAMPPIRMLIEEQVQGRALLLPVQQGQWLARSRLSQRVPAGKQPLTVSLNLRIAVGIYENEKFVDLVHRLPSAGSIEDKIVLENVPVLSLLREIESTITHAMLAVTPEEAALIARIQKLDQDEGKGELVIALRRERK